MRVWLLLFLFVSYLLIKIPLISFCCLIALARTSSTMLNIYRDSEQPHFVPDFSGIALSFSSFNLMLAVGLLYIAFIMFKYVPCIPALSKTFTMKGCCILPKVFSASSEMIMWFFLFSLFIWWITLIDFYMVNHPCISGMKLTWSWWMISLICSWILIASILLNIFASMFMSEIGL